MTNSSRNSHTNGHVNPFYLEIEEEHDDDDDELSDYEDGGGVEQAGLLRRPTVPPRTPRTASPSSRKHYRRICLFLVVALALLALKWDRKITPGGSEGEKPPSNDDDEVIDDDDDTKRSNYKDNETETQPTKNDTQETKETPKTTDTPNNNPDKRSCFQKGDSPIRLPSKDGVLRYACPCSFDNSDRPATHSLFPDHSSQISNMTRFMKTFRHMQLDDWGHSYAEVKKGMHDWIATRYAEYLTANSLIYDSAIGEGLHTHMVLDILLEMKQIRNITVYGNDLSSDSIKIATAMGERFFPGGGKLGTVCQGDSTQLQYVPSASFDLVFAAYIPPLSDPLELNPSNDSMSDYYLTLCKRAEANDEEAMKVKRDAQHRQDRWFALYLAELARVAKKGAPIIVEHISYP